MLFLGLFTAEIAESAEKKQQKNGTGCARNYTTIVFFNLCGLCDLCG
jgi:hypothetical protein